jgi:putative tryptophan/tyrosine transport system substrate-binding protein
MAITIGRRQFISALGGTAVAWSLVARAQQDNRMRRIGVLMGSAENDPEARAYLSGFRQGLSELGWTDGRNQRVDVRWAVDVDRIRTFAKELVDLQPDVILTFTTPVTAALQRQTRTIPIVFVAVADPVGAGIVASLSRPGGNLTGFIFTEEAMGGKCLELLTEIAPSVKRAAIIFNPDTAPGGRSYYYLRSFEAAARLLKVEPITAIVQSDAEIEASITSLGREPGGGLVVPGDIFLLIHRAPTILLAARNHVPAVYYNAVFARDGGLLSYGPDIGDIFRRAALYVDRILRGAKPESMGGSWLGGLSQVNRS